MSSDRGDRGFLSRWALRKAEARTGGHADAGAAARSEPPPVQDEPRPTPAPGPASNDVSAVLASGNPVVAKAPAEASLPTLADVAMLSRTSDYSRFVLPGIDPAVSNAAMRKLFSDPHFNVMDGLDTYIDDYGKADPIPESMLRRMNQAISLGLFDADPAIAADDRVAGGARLAVAPTAATESQAVESQEAPVLPERPEAPEPDAR
jgi:hypothetical protein